MSPMGLAEYLGIRPTFVDGLSVGGSSFVYHAARAALAVGTGLCEVAVVATGQTGKSGGRPGRGIRGGGGGGAAAGLRLASSGTRSPGSRLIGAYAMAARRHMHDVRDDVRGPRRDRRRRPVPRVDEPEGAVPGPDHGRRRPELALGRRAAAPARLLRRLRRRRRVRRDDRRPREGPAEAAGARCSATASASATPGIGTMPDFTQTAAADTGKMAFEMAGLKPGDIECAELYDSFTITVAAAARGSRVLREGRGRTRSRASTCASAVRCRSTPTAADCPPCIPGMRGMFLMTEARPADPRRRRSAAPIAREGGVDTCLVHGVGGQLSSHATLILGKDA